MIQLVKHPTSAQVMISRFVSSSPASGSVLTARSLEPASDSVSPSLLAPPPLTLCLSKMNKCLKKNFFSNRIKINVLMLVWLNLSLTQEMLFSPKTEDSVCIMEAQWPPLCVEDSYTRGRHQNFKDSCAIWQPPARATISI